LVLSIFSSQAAVFLLAVVLGFALGIFYDIFRAIRLILKPKVILSAVFDLTFWFAVTLSLFFILLHVNFGEIRLFTFIGLTIGMILHFCTLSRFLQRLMNRAKKGLQRGVNYVMIKGTKYKSEVVRYGAKARNFKRIKKT